MKKQSKSISETLIWMTDRLKGKPLTFDEAVTYLDISESLLYKLTSKNLITHYKPNGGKIFFLEEDLKIWLTRNRIKSIPEIEDEAINHVYSKIEGNNDR